MKLAATPGMLLLGIWLILTGLLPLANVRLDGLEPLLHILAIAAGILILRSR